MDKLKERRLKHAKEMYKRTLEMAEGQVNPKLIEHFLNQAIKYEAQIKALS